MKTLLLAGAEGGGVAQRPHNARSNVGFGVSFTIQHPIMNISKNNQIIGFFFDRFLHDRRLCVEFRIMM